jgi:hypothetical protein
VSRTRVLALRKRLAVIFGDEEPRSMMTSISKPLLRLLMSANVSAIIQESFDLIRRHFLAAFDRLINIQDRRIGWPSRIFLVQLGCAVCLAASLVSAFAAEQREPETLHIAVYDVPTLRLCRQ